MDVYTVRELAEFENPTFGMHGVGLMPTRFEVRDRNEQTVGYVFDPKLADAIRKINRTEAAVA